MTTVSEDPCEHETDCEVVVVGAGPAGSAVAIRLAAGGRTVELIEAGRFDRPRIGESLAPEVRPLLTEIGVWDDVERSCAMPSLGTRSRWGGDRLETESYLVDPYRHGWQVDRRAFDETLARAAQSRGAGLRCGARATSATWRGRHWQLGLDDGATLRAEVLVDASGRSGRVARLLMAQRLVFDRLVGVARTWHQAGRIGDHVLVESAGQGWWYSAPVPGDQAVTVLMTDADICRRLRLTDPAAWTGALEETRWTAERLAAASPAGSLRSHAAFSSRTRRPDDDRPWLAVGDASLAVDPLTGSGVGRALRDAAEVAQTVEQLLDRGPDDDRFRTAIVTERERGRDQACDEYLRARLAVYADGPQIESPFWTRRHRVAANNLAGRKRHVKTR